MLRNRNATVLTVEKLGNTIHVDRRRHDIPATHANAPGLWQGACEVQTEGQA